MSSVISLALPGSRRIPLAQATLELQASVIEPLPFKVFGKLPRNLEDADSR
jgi:hypothetical protein